MKKTILDDVGLDLIFRNARTYRSWSDKPLSEDVLKAVYELMKWGPTSMNCCPLRIVLILSDEGRQRLVKHAFGANQKKILDAPATAIFGYDAAFYNELSLLYPHHPDAKTIYESNDALSNITALRNGTLQAAYFMIAARSLGGDDLYLPRR